MSFFIIINKRYKCYIALNSGAEGRTDFFATTATTTTTTTATATTTTAAITTTTITTDVSGSFF